MRAAIRSGLVMVALMGLSAARQPPHRLVIVVAVPGSADAARQLAMLRHDDAALRERDVRVEHLSPEAVRRGRPELRIEADTVFAVLLVGKDGGVKLRSGTPVAAARITALIDTMPMRQEEMRRGSGP